MIKKVMGQVQEIFSVSSSTIIEAFCILKKEDRRKITLVCFFQILLASLDLFGIVALGALGTIVISNQNESGFNFNWLTGMLGIPEISERSAILLLGLAALTFLMSKTIISILLTKRIILFFSRRGAQLTSNLMSKLLYQPLHIIQSRSTQETLFAVTYGVNLILIQILATGVVLVADFSTIVLIVISLFVIDAEIATVTLAMFLLVGIFLHQVLSIQANRLGKLNSELNIKSSEKIIEVFGAYRESVVRNRRAFYIRQVEDLRFRLAEAAGSLNFLPYVSKYAFESIIIVGALLIGVIQFYTEDTNSALATSAIFLAAASRIAPAALRLQQGLISIKASEGQAAPSLRLIRELKDAKLIDSKVDDLNVEHTGFHAEIEISNLTFTYGETNPPALSQINLTIPRGATMAIVGPSGAGKTTLVDLFLGILQPDNGEVLISGVSPINAITCWPGAISYVPQDVSIVSGTIRENICMGYPNHYENEPLILSAINGANLDHLIANSNYGLEFQVGEGGSNLSGGERQRIGIARALFTRPKLLVLDEATSSLDGETEAFISKSIQKLKGSTTVVMIAHRLSSIREADIVVYLEAGEIKAQGTFEEVRKSIPQFDSQAKSMGL
jgi:ABC-type multidrug transport system fused ATPase/permease subunit